MHLIFKTCSNLVYSVFLLARFINILTDIHWKALKRVLCSLQETNDLGFRYTNTLGFLKFLELDKSQLKWRFEKQLVYIWICYFISWWSHCLILLKTTVNCFLKYKGQIYGLDSFSYQCNICLKTTKRIKSWNCNIKRGNNYICQQPKPY